MGANYSFYVKTIETHAFLTLNILTIGRVLSFVKDEYTYGQKMARKGRTKVIYEGTFISNQSLFVCKTDRILTHFTFYIRL